MSLGSPTLGFNKYYGVTTSIQSTSDERAKHDIAPVEPEKMRDFIMALSPTWYRVNASPDDLATGFIAQQFLLAMQKSGMPEDYAGFNGEDPDHLCLDYGQVIAPIVSVVQQQQTIIEEQQAKIDELIRRVGDIETSLII
jgi:hypothetical protein